MITKNTAKMLFDSKNIIKKEYKSFKIIFEAKTFDF